MTEAPALLALDRIEAALTRIDAARERIAATCGHAAPAEDSAEDPAPHDAGLAARHENLKAAVARSLAGLDELLAART
ncbi:hypothetical protein [Novosphingobium soli]